MSLFFFSLFHILSGIIIIIIDSFKITRVQSHQIITVILPNYFVQVS